MNSRLLSVLVVFVAVGVLGYLIIDRLDQVEERMEEVGVRVVEVGEEARAASQAAVEANELSETALARAVTAEESARQAAVGRDGAARTAARAEVAAAMANREAREARAELARIEQERQAEIDRLEAALGGVVDTRRTAVGLVMNLGREAIEFDFDQAELRASERELLSRIAGVLLTARGFSVYVYGHTDDVGTADYNLMLSERRAQSVRDYLVEAGIDPEIIQAQGLGQSSPRVDDDSAEARQQNRRVEIGIVDVFLDYSDDTQP